MAESKYGRLFTEADVRRLIQRAFSRLTEPGVRDTTLAELIEMEGVMTFPADEPLFLLRAQDTAALGTLSRYFHEAVDAGCSDEHGQAVAQCVREFAAWQDANLERVKVPD